MHNLVWISESFLPFSKISKMFVLERLGERVDIAQIPGFQLMASDTDQRIFAESLVAESDEFCFSARGSLHRRYRG